MFNQSALLNVMLKAIEKATHHWRHDLLELEQLQIAGRPVQEFVKKSYAKTASLLKQELTKARPKYGLITPQEKIEANDDPHDWVVEPVDGILNFARALPYVACTIALLRDGKPYASVIYTPLNHHLFWTEQGNGAFSGGRRLRVSQRKDSPDLVLGTLFGQEGWQYKINHSRMHWRDWGCAILGIVSTATGSLDGFMARYEEKQPILSHIAGAILIQESGGIISDFQGQPTSFPAQEIILTSEPLHPILVSAIST